MGLKDIFKGHKKTLSRIVVSFDILPLKYER